MENPMSQEHEEGKQQNGHNVSIALIQKDIQYMRESMTKIETSISLFDRNFIRKEEVNTLFKESGDVHAQIFKSMEEFKKLLENKVDVKDFEPMKTILGRINWMVIAAVIVGLLALVINTGK